MIRIANKSDIPAMAETWKSSFRDSGEYIDFFMRNRFPSAGALIALENGQPVSQLVLLPGEMSLAGRRYAAYYLYAAATRPEYRGQGHMACLMEAAKTHAREHSVSYIALVPGEESLYGYYARFGFLKCFTYIKREFSREELSAKACEGGEIRPAGIAEITALRNACLDVGGAFLWDENAMRYAVKEHEAYRGKSICVFDCGRLCAWLLASRDGGTVYVSEFCALPAAFSCAAKALLESFGEQRFELRLRADGCDKDTIDGGMIFPVSREAEAAVRQSENSYIGLILD